MKTKIVVVSAVVAIFFAIATGKFQSEDPRLNTPEAKENLRKWEIEKEQQRASSRNELGALRAAEKEMRERLKAPASADFAGIFNSEISSLGDGRYRVISYVDAQNSFGAKIRTNFFCRVTVKGDNFTVSEFVAW